MWAVDCRLVEDAVAEEVVVVALCVFFFKKNIIC